MNNPLVSVVITTRNEAVNIRNCLTAIRAQTYPDIEIIVVDNASDDATKALALEFTPRVYDKGPERSAQRNHGMIEQAHGVYVLYLDADMILAPGLIAACVQHMQAAPETVGLFVSEVILGSGWWSQVRRFERSFYDGTVIDAARFLRRDSFIRAGGFDETLNGPEDWDLDKKLKKLGRLDLLGRYPATGNWDAALQALIRSHGVDPTREGNALFHNEAAFDLGRYLKKKSYYAKTFDAYTTKWGANDPDVRRQLGGVYRMMTVFSENGKWLKLMRHPLLTFGMLTLRGLVGVNYVMRRVRK